MNIQSVIQDISSVASAFNVLVVAIGYYMLVRLYSAWFRESGRERVAGGRPQVVFSADYTHVPEVGIVVRNFTEAPATEISFEFSAPIEHPDGRVLSDLRFLKEGLPFLEPEGEIRCPWGSLPDLISLLKQKGLEDGIRVTTRYKDLAEESYETAFTVNPLLFEGAGLQGSRGMKDLVEAVERLPGPDGGRRG